MALFLWYTVDGVGCRGGAQRVGWDGFQRSAWWFFAKVNKELSYHTICCLWSVTHCFWPAASTLPARLFTCLTDKCRTLNNSSCYMSKYIQREAADVLCASDKKHISLLWTNCHGEFKDTAWVCARTRLTSPWTCHRGLLVLSLLCTALLIWMVGLPVLAKQAAWSMQGESWTISAKDNCISFVAINGSIYNESLPGWINFFFF